MQKLAHPTFFFEKYFVFRATTFERFSKKKKFSLHESFLNPTPTPSLPGIYKELLSRRRIFYVQNSAIVSSGILILKEINAPFIDIF